MLEQSDLSKAIHGQVRCMYEAYPYPHYPLIAKPRWQEAYLASSLVLNRLAYDLLGHPLSVGSASAHRRDILVAGCGEMQPYVIRKLEPSAHHLTCVDLSATSLKRARLRLLGTRQAPTWVNADINTFLADRAPESFDHIEAYGVLHHLADPARACELFWSRLRPGGSLRVMVYNAHARQWIHQLQKVFCLLGLSPYDKDDLKVARLLLRLGRTHLPALASKLTALSAETINNDSRFIDTFFHVRELRLGPTRWLDLFTAVGFQPLALFDRYGELDDLKNPLWHFPKAHALRARSSDRRFENNLELILYKEPTLTLRPTLQAPALPFAWRKALPPLLWFDFDETRSISLRERYLLWQSFLAYVWANRRPAPPLAKLLAKLPLTTLQRLARLGALLPGMLEPKLRREVAAAMTEDMSPPVPTPGGGATHTPMAHCIEEALVRKQRYSSQRLRLILARLDRI